MCEASTPCRLATRSPLPSMASTSMGLAASKSTSMLLLYGAMARVPSMFCCTTSSGRGWPAAAAILHTSSMTFRASSSDSGFSTIVLVSAPPPRTEMGLNGAFQTSFLHLAVATSSLTSHTTPESLKSVASSSALADLPAGKRPRTRRPKSV